MSGLLKKSNIYFPGGQIGNVEFSGLKNNHVRVIIFLT